MKRVERCYRLISKLFGGGGDENIKNCFREPHSPVEKMRCYMASHYQLQEQAAQHVTTATSAFLHDRTKQTTMLSPTKKTSDKESHKREQLPEL